MYTTRVKLKIGGMTGVLKYSEEALIKERCNDIVTVRWDGEDKDDNITARLLELIEHESVSYLKRIIALDKERNVYYPGRGYDMKAYQEAVDILEKYFKNKK